MPAITELSQLDLNQRYSYADYLTWRLKEAVELIKGKIMLMSPAPNVSHQRISADINGMLYNYFKHKPCQFFAAPFDIRLYDRKKSILKSQDIYTVVQPDLCVICNPELLDKQGCNGAPDWIIEILSKGTAKRDTQIKYQLYQESGVQEYWLIYPEAEAVYQFVLDDDGRYQLRNMYAEDDKAVPVLFPDLAIDLAELFADCVED
ncbi:MAG: Uma2 family endonuclease [Methylovulum sp.]|uniref:Uma2 family endonuclease n=1 Tax=Methylovulum sp. TaxID=1916980 RepID=UPI00260DBF72|nr:Uma2 family endonuclease [Methylovulum sp.]MDD2725435.1 Uma2 family endonuclease [Methylovulum sp.]MDD5124472.1 Uma2 family endonuclease [Methylovulum sp.]